MLILLSHSISKVLFTNEIAVILSSRGTGAKQGLEYSHPSQFPNSDIATEEIETRYYHLHALAR